ncbi:MAG TPA: NfeD family protein [Thermoleophilaceae bacterium]|nr:NfeD family protein [Thermoleophilaceae bacterium]
MPDWSLWLIAAAALAAGEVATLGFFLGPVAVAAVVAAVVAGLGAGAEIQAATFVLLSAASIVFLRPVARRHLRAPARVRTGTAALVGERALVLEPVDADGGRVKLAGEVWSARSFDDDRRFEPGVRVEVLDIDGATALVAD